MAVTSTGDSVDKMMCSVSPLINVSEEPKVVWKDQEREAVTVGVKDKVLHK